MSKSFRYYSIQIIVVIQVIIFYCEWRLEISSCGKTQFVNKCRHQSTGKRTTQTKTLVTTHAHWTLGDWSEAWALRLRKVALKERERETHTRWLILLPYNSGDLTLIVRGGDLGPIVWHHSHDSELWKVEGKPLRICLCFAGAKD
jgi:hypothetical protein